MTRTESKAFTKKGLYMLATILQSKKTTKAMISIIETFAKLKNLARVMKKLFEMKNKDDQKSLID